MKLRATHADLVKAWQMAYKTAPGSDIEWTLLWAHMGLATGYGPCEPYRRYDDEAAIAALEADKDNEQQSGHVSHMIDGANANSHHTGLGSNWQF